MSQPNFDLLKAPFPASEVSWRAGSTNSEKTKAMALAYIDARDVMRRLDEAVGPEGWRDAYREMSGRIICTLSLRCEGEWIAKEDGAEDTDFEGAKGGLSDAFKRAAVKWGIGRYLYDLPAPWVDCEARGKTVVLKATPTLPAWALPGDAGRPTGDRQPPPPPKAGAGPAGAPGTTAQPSPEEQERAALIRSIEDLERTFRLTPEQQTAKRTQYAHTTALQSASLDSLTEYDRVLRSAAGASVRK